LKMSSIGGPYLSAREGEGRRRIGLGLEAGPAWVCWAEWKKKKGGKKRFRPKRREGGRWAARAEKGRTVLGMKKERRG
jgi:hypothetical protein